MVQTDRNRTKDRAPLATFALLTYNQEKYVAVSLRSALRQTYTPLEIIISDDASTDATVAIIDEMLSANTDCPHTIVLNVNKTNLGIGAHVSKVFHMANGQFLVLAAGDDISSPERVAAVMECWLKTDRKSHAIFCAARSIDREGNDLGAFQQDIRKGLHGPAQTISRIHRDPLLLKGACSAYSPNVISSFGDLMPGLVIEDTPLTVRASLMGEIEFVPRELVLYRIDTSGWASFRRDNETFESLLRRKLEHEKLKNCVFRQVCKDVRGLADGRLRRIAARRLIATSFTIRCLKKNRLSIGRIVRMACMTREWSTIILFCTLYSLKDVYRMLFFLKQKLT